MASRSAFGSPFRTRRPVTPSSTRLGIPPTGVATTARPCDVGLVGYEMAVLVEKCASALTPGLVSELQTALPRSAIR